MKKPRVVVLTGAGISAESGIKTFRATDGLWEDHHIEDVASPEGFLRNPELVQRFYNARRRQLQSAEISPNPAHLALVKLEDYLQDHFLLITQNVDDLHDRAGSQRLIHMHGELLKVRCVQSQQVLPWHADITPETHCQCCHPPQSLRPHIVWFGEMPLEMTRIDQQLAQADLFISIGTSGHVYPAAGFVEMAKNSGAKTIELNLDSTQGTSLFDEVYHGPAGIIVPEYIQQLLSQYSA